MNFLQNSFFDKYPHQQELLTIILLAFISITIYQIIPNFDLVVSDYFYNFETHNWYLDEQQNIFANIHNKIFGKYLYIVISLIFGGIFIYSFFDKDIKTKRNKLLFYLIVLGFSPVVLTAISKYYYERPRPYIIQNYNNSNEISNENTKYFFNYVAPFEKSQQCKLDNISKKYKIDNITDFDTNNRTNIISHCNSRDTKSFFSGHVSRVASYILFFWFLTGFARFIAYNLYFCLVVITIFFRVSTGNHYLSDCLVGFYITYFSIWLTHYLFHKFNINFK